MNPVTIQKLNDFNVHSKDWTVITFQSTHKSANNLYDDNSKYFFFAGHPSLSYIDEYILFPIIQHTWQSLHKLKSLTNTIDLTTSFYCGRLSYEITIWFIPKSLCSPTTAYILSEPIHDWISSVSRLFFKCINTLELRSSALQLIKTAKTCSCIVIHWDFVPFPRIENVFTHICFERLTIEC